MQNISFCAHSIAFEGSTSQGPVSEDPEMTRPKHQLVSLDFAQSGAQQGASWERWGDAVGTTREGEERFGTPCPKGPLSPAHLWSSAPYTCCQ